MKDNGLTIQEIQGKIINLPGRPPFMLDKDLAAIYETDTRSVNQAVKRNPKRFPTDFHFQLTENEMKNLKSQGVISIDTNKLPHGFTREGANMLSAVLHTDVAVERSVFIMRAFSAMEAEIFSLQEEELKSASQITGERFEQSVKRFKVALESVRLMGITDKNRARLIANDMTRDTTGVDLMAFILPYCARYPEQSKTTTSSLTKSEEDNEIWDTFISEWWDHHGDKDVTSRQLYDLIIGNRIPMNLGTGSKRSQKIRLGKMLLKMSGQQIGSYVVIDAGKDKNIRIWKLRPVGTSDM